MKLSEKAWQNSEKIIHAIKQHPFNQELMQGILPVDKFAYYIEQDKIYLQDFARCLSMIASKSSLPEIKFFLTLAENILLSEQVIVHDYLENALNLSRVKQIAPTTLSYTSYLLSVCFSCPVEVAIAAVLPCFWIYHEVGLGMKKDSVKNNPFSRWIDTYAHEDFGKTVKNVINIFDKRGEEVSQPVKSQMLEVFHKSTCLEWHFWNDCYYKEVFDKIPLSGSFLRLIP